jgi:hypothetical protein
MTMDFTTLLKTSQRSNELPPLVDFQQRCRGISTADLGMTIIRTDPPTPTHRRFSQVLLMVSAARFSQVGSKCNECSTCNECNECTWIPTTLPLSALGS